MSAFLPHDSEVWLRLAGLLVVILAVDRVSSKLALRGIGRLLSWLAVPSAVFAADRITGDDPAGFRMLALIAALLLAMKGVVLVESRRSGRSALSPIGWLAFTIGWLGMRPALFASVPGPARPGFSVHLRKGICFIAAGLMVGFAARWTFATRSESSPTIFEPSCIIAMMIAVSLTVHFGVCSLQAGVWRAAGADCRALFRAPLSSKSLKEFWGSRWNLAFSEMTALAVYRPLKSKLGIESAATIAFLFSGLLHEVAISLPVRAGFGGPLAYFGLHALAMRIEGRFPNEVFARRPWLGRLWTLAWIVLPLPLLFHQPFIEGVILPLLRTR